MSSYHEIIVEHTVSRADYDAIAAVTLPCPLPKVAADVFSKQVSRQMEESGGELDSEQLRSEWQAFGEQLARIDTSSNKGNDSRDGLWLERDTNFYPSNAVARLFTSSGSCSASIIGPNLILTAGHCLHPGGTGDLTDTYKDIFLQPQYPNGQWVRVNRVYVHREWVAKKAYYRDFAICVTDDMGDRDAWGLKTKLNIKTVTNCTLYGYPAEAPFDGQKMCTDGGPWPNKLWSSGRLFYDVIGADRIDLTGGCSGGPWIVGGPNSVGSELLPGKDSGRNFPYFASGLNSFQFTDFPGAMISPVFGAAAHIFFKDVLQKVTSQNTSATLT